MTHLVTLGPLLMNLMATWFPVALSSASTTTPNAPLFISFNCRQSPEISSRITFGVSGELELRWVARGGCLKECTLVCVLLLQTNVDLVMMMSFTVCWEQGVTHETCFSSS